MYYVCSLYASLRFTSKPAHHYYSTHSLTVVTKKLTLTASVTQVPIILVVNNTTLTNRVLAMATTCTRDSTKLRVNFMLNMNWTITDILRRIFGQNNRIAHNIVQRSILSISEAWKYWISLYWQFILVYFLLFCLRSSLSVHLLIRNVLPLLQVDYTDYTESRTSLSRTGWILDWNSFGGNKLTKNPLVRNRNTTKLEVA